MEMWNVSKRQQPDQGVNKQPRATIGSSTQQENPAPGGGLQVDNYISIISECAGMYF